MTNFKEICECGHPKKWHNGSTKFCKFIDKTENWDIPEGLKKEYLKLGINELAICSCKQFKPKMTQKEALEK